MKRKADLDQMKKQLLDELSEHQKSRKPKLKTPPKIKSKPTKKDPNDGTWVKVQDDSKEKGYRMVFMPSDAEKARLAEEKKKKDFQYELSKSGKTVLVEGRDDDKISELRNMLETIMNQPGDDLIADRERNIARSILGNDVKTAGILDSLKPKERKPKEEVYYKSKEDFSPDQLKKIEEDLLKRMEEQSMPLNFPGWKGTTPSGVVYTLSRPQLNMIAFLYENALIRMKGEDPSQVRREKRKQENEQEEQENQKQNAIRKKLREKTKRKDEPAPLLDDDDLGDLDLDLDGFGKSARINSIKSLIKSARNIIKRIKI